MKKKPTVIRVEGQERDGSSARYLVSLDREGHPVRVVTDASHLIVIGDGDAPVHVEWADQAVDGVWLGSGGERV